MICLLQNRLVLSLAFLFSCILGIAGLRFSCRPPLAKVSAILIGLDDRVLVQDLHHTFPSSGRPSFRLPRQIPWKVVRPPNDTYIVIVISTVGNVSRGLHSNMLNAQCNTLYHSSGLRAQHYIRMI